MKTCREVGLSISASAQDAEGRDLGEALLGIWGDSTEIERYERPKIQNVLEWAVPATVILTIWISGKFFGKFFEKLGEGSAELLLDRIKRSYGKGIESNERMWGRSDFEEYRTLMEGADSPQRTASISGLGVAISPLELTVKVVDGEGRWVIRFVFVAGMSDDDISNALGLLRFGGDGVVGKMISDHSKYIPFEFHKLGGVIDCIYHPGLGEWVASNDYIRMKSV